MEISFKNKLLNPQEIRAINTEIILFENQKRPSFSIMRDEKRMLREVFDYVASKEGQRGTLIALLKLSPDLKQSVPHFFKGHVQLGNLVSLQNYLAYFPELKQDLYKSHKLAAKKSRENPNSTERKEIVELFGKMLRS